MPDLDLPSAPVARLAPPGAPPAPARRAPAGALDEPLDPGAIALRIAAVLVLLLSFLPIASWIAGGNDNALFGLQMQEWGSGSAIAIGIAVVLTVLSRHRPGLWRTVQPGALDAWAERRFVPATAAITVVALALYIVAAIAIFGRRPQTIDEIAQTIQARIFLTGALSAPVPQPLEFFSTQHMVYTDGRAFSQFPPGGPAAIALFMRFGVEWLAGPVFAAASVVLFAAYLRRSGERPGTTLLAVALFALAPFTLFMAGSRMNHVMTTTFTLAASLALVAAARSATPRPLLGLVCGLCYGLAATFRPVDAAAFAIPGAIWLVMLALRDRRRIPDLLLSGIGVAIPLAAMLWVNARTTGHPTLFGYQMLWGKGHDLGFHVAPWGTAHTPARGLELINIYFFLLQRSLFETPVPALLAAVGAFLLVRRTSGEDRYLLGGSLLVVLAYWAYWHNGYFLGPRFLVPIVPLLVLWTARFPTLLRERLRVPAALPDGSPTGPTLLYRGVVYTMFAATAIALCFSIPLRADLHRRGFAAGRWSAEDGARAAGVRNAVVLVREGWESQLVVRLWQLGVSHPKSELYYRAIDACRLEGAIDALERTTAGQPVAVSTAETERTLDRMLPDSSRVRTVRLVSHFNLRVQDGVAYSPRCMSRVQETESGVLALSPLVASRPDGNVYARDLHERDTLLLQRYPGRPIYLLHPAGLESEATPVFSPVSVDSLRAAWSRERLQQ